jgi:ketosteroid isomerase-like protein
LATTTIRSGDIALTHTRWRLDIPNADAMESVTAEIVRRQPDGTWKYAIDNPWGGSVLDAR